MTKGISDRLIKLVAISLLLYCICCSIMLYHNPSPSYEASIYLSVSPLYWSMIILNFLFGTILILTSFKKHISNLYSNIGFFFLYLTYLLSISTHIIRGYAWWNLTGDAGTHLGIVKEILWTGFCPKDIIYPASHILLTEYRYILNVDIQILHILLPVMFSLFFPLGVHLFSKILLNNPIEIKIATVFGFLFLPGVWITFTPNGLFNSLFPFLLFIILKSIYNTKYNWKILALLVILLLPMFHPLAGVIIGLIIISIVINIVCFDDIYYKYYTKKHGLKLFSVLILAATLGIIWLSWQMQFQESNLIISNIVNTLNNEEYYRQSIILNDLAAANKYGLDIVDSFIKTYGVHLISCVISVLALVTYLVKRQDNRNIFWVWVSLGFLYILVGLGLFFEFGFGPTRFLVYSTILAIPLFGYLGGFLVNKNIHYYGITFNHILITIGLMLLLFVTIIGFLTIYPSPYTLNSNLQTTTTELTGMNWYFINKDPGLEITGINLPTSRFYEFIFGIEDKKSVLHGLNSFYSPFHFGYDVHRSFSDSYDNPIYLGITTRDLFKYQYVYPQMADYRWNLQDFQRIHQDIGILKIYTNNGYELYLVGT